MPNWLHVLRGPDWRKRTHRGIMPYAIQPSLRKRSMDFRTHVTQEKKRLAQQRQAAEKRTTEVESQLRELGGELEAIHGELAAIEAYEKASTATAAPRRRRASKADASTPPTRARRRRRGSRRAEILSAITSFGSAGVGRGGIIDALNVKGDKSAEQSVSNALAALKKSGEVSHQDGKYIVVTGDSGLRKLRRRPPWSDRSSGATSSSVNVLALLSGADARTAPSRRSDPLDRRRVSMANGAAYVA